MTTGVSATVMPWARRGSSAWGSSSTSTHWGGIRLRRAKPRSRRASGPYFDPMIHRPAPILARSTAMTNDSIVEYGDSVTTVEPYGVDHIPDSERHGKPWHQFSV